MQFSFGGISSEYLVSCTATTFTPFFVTCLGEKEATVRNYRQAEQPQREHAESVGERMARRPPAELPVGASTRGFVPGERHNG